MENCAYYRLMNGNREWTATVARLTTDSQAPESNFQPVPTCGTGVELLITSLTHTGSTNVLNLNAKICASIWKLMNATARRTCLYDDRLHLNQPQQPTARLATAFLWVCHFKPQWHNSSQLSIQSLLIELLACRL